MMMRHFSVMTPGLEPVPRAAWHASASARKMEWRTLHCKNPGSTYNASPIRPMVVRELRQSANRLRLSQGPNPSVLTGALRAAIDGLPGDAGGVDPVADP
jgi:hypothetical protein